VPSNGSVLWPSWHMFVCSGRELAKFMAAVQAAVYGSPEATLTPEIWNVVLSRKLYEHQERRNFRLGHHGTPGDAQALAPKS
jgi:ATPase family AAA domain-containing protein 3A/B